jgi:inhibitor of KinA sporulation pathway (predicted exonuclease)
MRFDASRWMVIDLESTCWEKPEHQGLQESEVIEIGIAVVDLRKRVVEASHQIYVTPVKSTVSAFCTALTGITNQVVSSEGVHFPVAWDRLEKLGREHNLGTWASWGDYDRDMLLRMCKQWNEPWKLPRTHMNLKVLEATMRGRDRGVGQKRSVSAAGLQWEGRNHCGRDDAAMAARVLLELWKGVTP